ncbi:hypothetical protein [Acidaminococcus timonensis]|uniref:hypothetical protein n=1 Tax=Acidaminococcus timonensis TaxID=1871002 RepID=UPI002943736D|nr:hypothetical protein [Acidaminococcus timonensis]
MVKGRDVEDQTKKRVLCLLAHYDELQVWVENRKSEIAMLQEEIQIEPAPKTTQWRESPGGGSFEKPSPEEAALERKERLLKLLAEKENKLHRLITDKEKLDRSLNGLWESERYVVEICTIRRKGMTWKQVAVKLGYSPDAESACRRRFWKAIDHLVLMFKGGNIQGSLLT